ncbi:PIN domain-containing protein [Arthrobacter sp. 2MCAF14]|uniref:PIN domain-containing protein n=1 Tax=Arthrobacter sp. 2MCAF14 TaxID=3232982 RepID=UPI003F8FFD55
MIIFDTNAVNLLPPNGPRADIIRKLRESGHHRVAVPWMVLEEMAAHKAVFYLDRHRSAVTVLQKLQDVLPWELESSLEPLDLERLLNHWRDAYREIFEVIDTSGEIARSALAREAMALPPAKRDRDRSEGARDVAIWFSILEFLKENPEENICFVTNNTDDFGDGTAYAYPMDEDLRGLEGRLTRLADFNQVVSQFTKEVSGKDAEAVGDLLRSFPIQSRLAQTAVEILSSPTGFAGMSATDVVVQWRSWMTSPEAELLSVMDVVGHEIEGDIWYTANARWLLYGVATDGNDTQSIACVWEVKVLFSASEEDQTPTLLTPGEPSLPDMADERCAEALKRLKERAADVARRTLANLSANSSAAGSYLAQQMAASMPKLDIAGLMGTANLAQQMAAAMPKFDIAGLLPSVNLAQQIAAAMPKYDIAGLIGTANLAQQMAASMPKLDIAGLLPSVNLAQQLAASMPKYDVNGLAYLARATESSSDDETESNEDEETEEDEGDSP